MEDIAKKLIWLVFIFPGFVTVTIISAIVDLGEVGELSLIFYGLALTFLNVVIGFLVALLIALFLRPLSVRPGLFSSLVIFTVATLLVSIGSGIVIGIALEQGSFFDLVRKVPVIDVLNKRSHARPLIFLLRQNTGGRLDIEGDGRPQGKVGEAYLRVYLDDDVIYEGWPEFYDSKPTEIYLSPACRITEHNEDLKARTIPGPGVVIPESEIKHAILVDRKSSPCYREYFPDPNPAPTRHEEPSAR